MKKLVAVGISKAGEPRFTIQAEEKPLYPGEYSIKTFKSMYPVRYRNLVRCGLPFFVNGKITVMP